MKQFLLNNNRLSDLSERIHERLLLIGSIVVNICNIPTQFSTYTWNWCAPSSVNSVFVYVNVRTSLYSIYCQIFLEESCFTTS
ncbi:unnamed protein product [Rotaria sp. Silwood1]|nr:unnamed protein product [Rotaria sp. Silwood1]